MSARRKMRWKDEPELQAVMESMDHEHLTRAECARAFEERTGISIDVGQVQTWRKTNGRTDAHRTSHRTTKRSLPVGSERVNNKGYTLVKVKPLADVPQSNDNWRMKHVLVWEREHGGPVPEGHIVVFANGDKGDFAPDNLVAVPRHLMPQLNGPLLSGWNDAETLRACVAIAELNHRLRTRERDVYRKCTGCGAVFRPSNWQEPGTKVCPECAKRRESA